MKKLLIWHSSPVVIEKFDISQFRENCLDIDTNQFGMYFHFIDAEEIKKLNNETFCKSWLGNTAHYGLRNGNKKAYMHIGGIEIDETRMIDSFGKISVDDTDKLLEPFGLPTEEVMNFHSKCKNNRQLFFVLIKNLKRNNWSWEDIANHIIACGYDGYLDGDNFGTVVIINVDKIKLFGYIKYSNKSDFYDLKNSGVEFFDYDSDAMNNLGLK